MGLFGEAVLLSAMSLCSFPRKLILMMLMAPSPLDLCLNFADGEFGREVGGGELSAANAFFCPSTLMRAGGHTAPLPCGPLSFWGPIAAPSPHPLPALAWAG